MLDQEEYRVIQGDCVEAMAEMPEAFADHAVFSPPFPAVYAYTDSPADIGNSEDRPEAKVHLSFFFRAMRRVMKPGRVMMVHVQQIVNLKRSGGKGMFDFRGLVIRLGLRAGFVYDYDWLISKNPQSQAIRTKSHSLQFAGLEADRAQSRGAMGDYLIKFLAPGENAVPVNSAGEVSRNDWIEWAEACWGDIRETETLNVRGTKGEEDTKHIAPLQLGVIARSVKLYTNPGEVVFSPFTGIGSEGYMALLLGRRFVGCELKAEYHRAALANLARALVRRREESRSLFDALTEANP